MNSFAVCVFVLTLSASVTAGPAFGKCPDSFEISSFDLNKYLGEWYEIARTNVIFEIGLKCVKADYILDEATQSVKVNNTGVNDKGITTASVGVASPTQMKNVFGVKFFELQPAAQYWVVDTDYKSYALVISCNDLLGLFSYQDAWILSRGKALDTQKFNELNKQYTSLGFTEPLKLTPQDC